MLSLKVDTSQVDKYAEKIWKYVQEQLLGASYTTMINILFAYLDNNADSIVSILSNIENAEKFTQSFFTFMLDVQIYEKTFKQSLVNIPDSTMNILL